MSQPAGQSHYSIPEYLEFERKSVSRHEYHDGRIIAMAEGSVRHAMVQSNVFLALGYALKGKTCRPFGSDLKVHIPTTRRFVYPDVSVICGDPITDPSAPGNESVTNPTMIVEVLSASTEQYDRTKKFGYYMAIETLREYVLVSTDETRIESFSRQNDATWSFRFADRIDQSIELNSISVTLSLAEVFAGVNFDPADERR